MITYTILSDGEVNYPLGSIDEKGNLLNGVDALNIIFAEIKNGSESDKANNLLCVPDTEHPEIKDVITLGELKGRPSRHVDDTRANNLLNSIQCNELDEHIEDTRNVIDECEVVEKDLSRRVPKSGNRYMSKVEWDSKKIRKKIKRYIAGGRTLSYIARCLEVSRSTLSKANKRYGLYTPHLYRINQC